MVEKYSQSHHQLSALPKNLCIEKVIFFIFHECI